MTRKDAIRSRWYWRDCLTREEVEILTFWERRLVERRAQLRAATFAVMEANDKIRAIRRSAMARVEERKKTAA